MLDAHAGTEERMPATKTSAKKKTATKSSAKGKQSTSRTNRPPGRESAMSPRPDHGERSYRGSGRLTGKVALVTGGDSGIGRAVALAFAREGADVAISYLDEHDDARGAARSVEDAGRRALTISGDVGSETHCRSLVDRTIRELGRLDVLVNNAAFQREHEDIAEFTPEEVDRTFRTNVYAMFWLCQAALPHLPRGGAIINVSSIQAYEPSPTLLAYATTKGAIVTFSKALSKQAIERGVRVNVVAPGPVWTPLIPSTMPGETLASFGADTPIGRAAQPAELAGAFVFLASDDSRYITGEVIGVTGGKLLP
jgi:NAD(P)-dependent dehydrogenase (short-subunit alcohol dehydrogenase family)